MQLHELVDGDEQVFSPARIAGALRTTKAEIADTLGLSRDALSRAARIRASKTQTRLREMVEILHRVETYTGSPPLVAYAWFRSEALPGFAGLTPDQLVRQGKAKQVDRTSSRDTEPERRTGKHPRVGCAVPPNASAPTDYGWSVWDRSLDARNRAECA